MYKNLKWKIVLVFVVTAVAVLLFSPPSRKISLGLDLKGGLQLVYAVKTDDALRLETETASEQLRTAMKDAGVTVTVKVASLTEFTVEGVPAASDQQFRTAADQQTAASFDRTAMGGGVYSFRMKPNVAVNLRTEAVTQAVQTIERRVNELGVSEPWVAPYGTGANQIVVQLPGLKDVARAQAIISNTAILELKLVEAGPAPDQATLLTAYGGKVPDDMEVLPGTSVTPGSAAPSYYLVRKTAAVTGRDLRNARPTTDEYNQPAVSFTLNSGGAAKFAAVTRANVNRSLAIVLDNQVVSAPNIEGPIDRGEARITGRFTQQEASDLALVLRSGALPATLTQLEHREVGPTLGADSIRAGIMASVIGHRQDTPNKQLNNNHAPINPSSRSCSTC
jgi:preprotein translocase subunit SecD